MSNGRVLVTGSSGFVGHAVVDHLLESGRFDVVATARSDVADLSCRFIQSDLCKSQDFGEILSGVDFVIHCAAFAQPVQSADDHLLGQYIRLNVDVPTELARQAATSGVKRFIFLSSVKVNGDSTQLGRFLSESVVPAPQDCYGRSKRDAEKELQKVAEASSLDVVVIRPPLIYGPGVKGNLLSLLKLAKSGLPLPLGAVKNLRSMIYLGNLVDLILKCIDSPAAANQVFLASDAHDISTSELLRLIRNEMGLPHRLVPVPPAILYMLGQLSGKRAVVDRLCGSLQVDCSKARQLLGWQPPYSVEHGVSEMVKDFMKSGL